MSVANRQLVEKIQAFIRRFYLNRLLKGLLLGIVLLILLMFGVHGLEFFALVAFDRKDAAFLDLYCWHWFYQYQIHFSAALPFIHLP